MTRIMSVWDLVSLWSWAGPCLRLYSRKLGVPQPVFTSRLVRPHVRSWGTRTSFDFGDLGVFSPRAKPKAPSHPKPVSVSLLDRLLFLLASSASVPVRASGFTKLWIRLSRGTSSATGGAGSTRSMLTCTKWGSHSWSIAWGQARLATSALP